MFHHYQIEEHPWSAALGIRIKQNNSFLPLCAGTIITSSHILTAAHCLKSTYKP